MNKTAIKNFAIWARNRLIADIKYRAGLMGITENGIAGALPQSNGTTEFYDIGTAEPYAINGEEIKQRRALVDVIRAKEKDSDYAVAYKYIIEEVAYTWFNRLIAVRFMEVNDYLPSHVRVLSSESGKTEPDIVTNPFDAELNLSSAEEEKIITLKRENKFDEAFKMLFIKQCNALNEILPALFEKTSDYTELLLNLSVIDQDGVVYHLIHDIPEEDFNVSAGGQVEIIGWMYQYYNTEPNEQVYDGTFSKEKVKKELLPAATTIYTPDWAIRYMVENSLGSYCVEHGIVKRIDSWKYYINSYEKEEEKKEEITNIKFLDPCMGSGHILVYAFEVFMEIYRELGYTEREAATLIVKNNLYGLDIDDRAGQLAYFAVMMKARQYNRRIFKDRIKCNLFSIKESNSINLSHVRTIEREDAHSDLEEFIKYLKDAKEYGSILKIPEYHWNNMLEVVDKYSLSGQISIETVNIDNTISELKKLINIGRIMTLKYQVVCTNPPYLGSGRFSPKLDKYVKNNYDIVKNDLSMVMYKKAIDDFIGENGYISFITTSSWLTLSSFEKLRVYAQNHVTLTSLVDFGTELFEGKVGHNPIVAWTVKNKIENMKGVAIRLVDYCYSRKDEKNFRFFEKKNQYKFYPQNFSKLPGNTISYWVSESILKHFGNESIGNTFVSGGRNKTHNNDKYLRVWWEISDNIRWQPYDKGGDYRKWYGNHEYLVDWSENAKSDYASHGGLYNQKFANKIGICWSLVTSYKASFRVKLEKNHYDSGAPVIFNTTFTLDRYTLALLNSVVGELFLKILNPSVNMGNTYVLSVPMIRNIECDDKIDNFTEKNIQLSRMDWDAFETSWNFKCHPLLSVISHNATLFDDTDDIDIAECYICWENECNERFNQLKANEEELNRIFIDIYGLQEELTPEVEDKDVTVRKADLQRDIKSLISYAVGCMFGRYSLNEEGLIYAGGEWDDSRYTTFIPDRDNIIPITDEEYLEDDIVSCFCTWLKTAFGAKSLETNLDFIAKALGNKGDTSREIIRNYFLNDFFKDHCNTYSVTGSGKRPIYWLFDSGKQNGFKALVYLHRYNADTIGNVRVDYLYRMQRVYESEIGRMQDTIDNSKNSREVSLATKRKEKLQKQLKECREYDEKIGHLALARIELDLDDGVKVNYRKVQTAADGKFYEILADSKNIMAKEK